VKDYYSILGIPRYASEQTIKEAYRRLAKRWHPDANSGDENAQRMMQDLNRAKEVLFHHDTREEYRRVLEMQDALSAENIERLRKTYKDRRFQDSGEIERHRPFAKGRFILLMVLISATVGIAIVKLAEISSSKQVSSDPIENIIKRNQATQLFPVVETDTITIPDVQPDRLAQMASMLAMMNEYKGAIKYWERYLESDQHNTEVTTSLMLAYLHRNEIGKAVQTISDHIVGDSNLVIIYSTLGDYFRQEQKIFDAANAYEKVVQVGAKIEHPSNAIATYIETAKKRIASR
jgi:tetratricopeptide (TPR) repeat protein